MSFIEEFDHLKIQLKDIISATDNFNPKKVIGHGGFGPVYKGELSLPEGRTMVAFKRLDRKHGQGNNEFWKEIMMLSKYKHENLVTLLHFCIEGDERILVYKHVSRGSLDRYLSDTSLTWTQRLKICIGVAQALNYLHDPMETHRRVLHRDVKSSNILLDENWDAKVSDFGLSKVGPANQSQTYLFSNLVGTAGYCDPLYLETGFLSKESDVYSFGVVLLEVMCGKLCCEYRDGKLNSILVHKWKKCCDEKRLDDIIFHDLKEQKDRESLIMFSAIAIRCLNRDRKERPTMDEIIKELEVALEKHIFSQRSIYSVKLGLLTEERRHLVKLGKLAEPPLSYKTQEELLLLLSKGFRYKDTTWLSIDKNERVCEMISAIKCITDEKARDFQVIRGENSRFDDVIKDASNFKLEVSTQFLIPHVTYNINLIYKLKQWDHGTCIPFKYKLDEETDYSGPFIEELREDGWYISQLYQFTCYQSEQHFTIECLPLGPLGCHILEGIEFRPLDYEVKEKKKVNIPSIPNTDTSWEQKLPTNYTDLINLSRETIQWTTKKGLYFLLRQGFLIDNGENWFSINKNTKKHLMIPATSFLTKEEWKWKSFPESRFEMVAESLVKTSFIAKCKIKSQLLSPNTTYSCHLIYKLPENYPLLESILVIRRSKYRNFFYHPWYIYLIPPHTPIIGPNVDEKPHIPSYTRKIEGHPKFRKDGWMECQFWKVSTSTSGTIKMHLDFRSVQEKMIVGLVVQGIEFRPL